MKRYVVLLAGIALLATGAFLFAAEGQPVQAARGTDLNVAAGVTIPAPSLTPSAPSRAQRAPAPTPPAFAAIRAALADSTDVRAFALAALQRPGEGGYFYARHAVNECGADRAALQAAGQKSIANAIGKSGTANPAQLKAVEQFTARCSSFIDGEAGSLVGEIRARQQSGQDPLLAAEQTLIEASRSGDSDRLKAAVASALALQDSALLTDNQMLVRLASSDIEARKVAGLWIDGRLISGDDPEFGIALHALQLGGCLPNQPCAIDHEMRVACAFYDLCVGERDAFIMSRLRSSGMPSEQAEKVIALAQRVRGAIERQDVAFFAR